MTQTLQRRELRIGQLAAELGLNPKTIRYYEDIGLLPNPERTPAGYRLYNVADRDRLEFIGKAKALGLSLEEIHEILALRDQGDPPCEHVLALVDQKVAAVDQQIQLLTEFRHDLLQLRAAAVEIMPADAQVCRIIEHHARVHADAAAKDAPTEPRRRKRAAPSKP